MIVFFLIFIMFKLLTKINQLKADNLSLEEQKNSLEKNLDKKCKSSFTLQKISNFQRS